MHRRRALSILTAAASAPVIAPETLAVEPSRPASDAHPTHEDTFGLAEQGKKIPVIFDTDIGSDIDDTWALLYMLRCPELKPLMVATDAGQGQYRASLTAKFLEACDRTDVPVAVGPGGVNPQGNQAGWVGQYERSRYAGEVMPDAVEAIIAAVHGSPDPVTLVCIGGVPNIAAALEKDPSICTNARFVGMHGAIRVGYDGKPPAVPEANVRRDPPALRKTFAAPWQCSITPLDTCGDIVLRADRYARWLAATDRGNAALLANYRDWLQRVPWLKVKPDPEKQSSTLFDLVAVYMAFSEAWLDMETLPIAVTDDGMTVVREDAPSVRCALKWNDQEAFLDHLVNRLTTTS